MGDAKTAKAAKVDKVVTGSDLARVASEMQSALRRGGVAVPFRIITVDHGSLAILVQDDATLPVAVRATPKGGYAVSIWPGGPVQVSSTWAINETQLVDRYNKALVTVRAITAAERLTNETMARSRALIDRVTGDDEFNSGSSAVVEADGRIHVTICGGDLLDAWVHPAMDEVATAVLNACMKPLPKK